MQENDVHYKYLFEKSGVSIWNEDLSEVVLELERLRTKGVTDIRKYLHTNPKVVFKFLEKVKVLEVNNATLQLFEAHDKESFLESIDKCFGENAIDVFIDELEAIWERREAFRSDANFITTTGKNITCQVSFQIPEIIDEFRYLPVTLVDITETIIAKGALRDSLQKFEAIRKCSIPMLFMYDSDGLITLSEGKMLAAVGLEPGQLAGQNVFEVYADYPDVVTALKKPFSGEPYEGYIELDELVFEVFYSPYFDTQGNVSNVLGMAMDITKRKKLEDTLSKNEERFRKLFDDTDAISIQGYDHNQIVTYWNRASEQLYGYSAQQAIGESLYDLIIPRAMHEQARRDIHNWIENDIPIPAESLTLQRADGSPINVYSSHVFLRDDNDQPEMFCIDIDLTAQVEAQKALNASEEKYRLLVENANEGILVIQHGLFKYSNSAASNLFGATPEHLLDTAFIDYVHSDDRTIVANRYARRIRGQAEPSIYSCRIVDRNAATKWADINVVTITWENEIATLTFISDITSQKEAEFALVESELRYRSIFETSVGAIIVVQGDNGNITEWNAGAQHIFGYQYDEVVGKPVSILLPARYQKAHQAGFDKAVARGELAKSGIRHELNGIRNDGTEFPIELTLSSFQREAEVYFSASILDISERKQAEQQLLHQAHYDNLTGLPNRFLSLDRLSQLLIDAKRESTQVAVIFIDLDDFKKVNDTLGHEAGDMMLREAAARLESVVRSGDTVGRLGGDEFIVLLGNLDTAAEVQPVSENLLETFRNPFVIENREIILTSSLGVAMYPDDGFDASELLRNADAAMYNSKDIGRNTYSFFTESMNMYVQRRLELEEHIHSALDRGEFKVYFQAQIDIATENIVGAEALLRWYNPQLGSISPDEFIPVAEHTGIIIPIGKYVLEEALAMAARWQKEIIPDFKIAVNLSPRQFRDPELVSVISESVKKAKLPYANLELEITEGVLISGHGFMEQALQDIGKLGIQIAMDDFGTGYSSLNYLRKYPFDALKIDRSFIFDISTDAADRELIAATIAMAHALGLSVVAEGIETQEQLKFLKNLNCDFGQGYLFGKPVSANEFSSLLKKS